MLALVMHRMQNGAKVQMGPFSELNYEKATDVSYKVYDTIDHTSNYIKMHILVNKNDLLLFDGNAGNN